MGIILIDVIPFELTQQYEKFLEYYNSKNTNYTSGCKATVWPAYDFGKNVKSIDNVRVVKGGKNVKVKYINRQGRKIEYPFSPNLDRKAFHISKLNGVECQNLLQFMEDLYESITEYWVRNNGCPEEEVEEVLEEVKEGLQLCGNKLNQTTSRMGVHSDPSLPFPSGIFGPTTHTLNEEGTKWERQCGGGELLLVDGFIPMRYDPQDVVFIDGNLLHGVTNLSKKEVNRFSMQIYTDYLRNTNKHGKYGTYDSRTIWN